MPHIQRLDFHEHDNGEFVVKTMLYNTSIIPNGFAEYLVDTEKYKGYEDVSGCTGFILTTPSEAEGIRANLEKDECFKTDLSEECVHDTICFETHEKMVSYFEALKKKGIGFKIYKSYAFNGGSITVTFDKGNVENVKNTDVRFLGFGLGA